MKTVFRYPGGKTRILSRLLDIFRKNNISTYDIYAEPFVGGGSVALKVATEFPSMRIVVNDKDEWISSFWEVIKSKDESYTLSEMVKEYTPNINLFYELRNTTPENVIDKAFYSIFFNRTTFSGILNAGPIGGRNQVSEWGIGCRFNSKYLSKTIIKIHELLSGRLEVYNEDYTILLEKYDGSFFYLDPPYFVKGNSLYREGMELTDHLILASSLEKMSNWVLSYDNCSDIREIYSWAHQEAIDSRYSIKGKKTGWKDSKELVITKE